MNLYWGCNVKCHFCCTNLHEISDRSIKECKGTFNMKFYWNKPNSYWTEITQYINTLSNYPKPLKVLQKCNRYEILDSSLSITFVWNTSLSSIYMTTSYTQQACRHVCLPVMWPLLLYDWPEVQRVNKFSCNSPTAILTKKACSRFKTALCGQMDTGRETDTVQLLVPYCSLMLQMLETLNSKVHETLQSLLFSNINMEYPR